MGASGGIKLYKLSEIQHPQVWDRIVKWFMYVIFEGKDTVSEWYDAPIDPAAPWRRKSVERVLTRSEWFKGQGIEDEKSLTIEFISRYFDPSISVWSKSSWPVTEDLVRISYGDNVSDSIDNLVSIIDGDSSYLDKLYGVDDNEEFFNLESWQEETWT